MQASPDGPDHAYTPHAPPDGPDPAYMGHEGAAHEGAAQVVYFTRSEDVPWSMSRENDLHECSDASARIMALYDTITAADSDLREALGMEARILAAFESAQQVSRKRDDEARRGQVYSTFASDRTHMFHIGPGHNVENNSKMVRLYCRDGTIRMQYMVRSETGSKLTTRTIWSTTDECNAQAPAHRVADRLVEHIAGTLDKIQERSLNMEEVFSLMHQRLVRLERHIVQ